MHSFHRWLPSYRWLLVGIGGLIGCVAAGAIFALAVFVAPISAATGWSRAAISSAMTLDFLMMGVAAFAWGAVTDRVGARVVLFAGGLILGAGLCLASQAASPLMFQLGFGVLVGIAGGAFFAPLIATVTGWFDSQRALAVSLVSAGIGMAPMTISPLAAWLVSHYDWRTSMAAIGCLAWVLLVPAALLVRRAPSTASPEIAPATSPQQPTQSLKGALFSTEFLVLGLTYFLCCGAHSGPIFHFVSYAISCGLPTMAAVSVYSVEGFGGLIGRVLFGVAADRLSAKPVLIGGLLLQSIAILAYMHVSRQSEFYLLGTVFGAAYGGVMPLYAVIARDYFDQRHMGTVFGAATMLSSVGMAFGPVAGGWMFDTYHDYRWLYLGSAAIALAATAMAVTFPTVPSSQRREVIA